MAEKPTNDEQISMSKRAYARGFINASRQSDVPDDDAKKRCKEAIAHREELYSDEVQGRMKKRAGEIGEVIKEAAAEKSE